MRCWLTTPTNPNHLGPEGDPEGAGHLQPKVENMKKEYDFSKGRRNPYASRLKRQVTIRLDDQTIKYFKAMSGGCGIPRGNRQALGTQLEVRGLRRDGA